MTERRPIIVDAGTLRELAPGETVIGHVASVEVRRIAVVSQDAYDALSEPDPQTLYLIPEPRRRPSLRTRSTTSRSMPTSSTRSISSTTRPSPSAQIRLNQGPSVLVDNLTRDGNPTSAYLGNWNQNSDFVIHGAFRKLVVLNQALSQPTFDADFDTVLDFVPA